MLHCRFIVDSFHSWKRWLAFSVSKSRAEFLLIEGWLKAWFPPVILKTGIVFSEQRTTQNNVARTRGSWLICLMTQILTRKRGKPKKSPRIQNELSQSQPTYKAQDRSPTAPSRIHLIYHEFQKLIWKFIKPFLINACFTLFCIGSDL